MRTIRYGSAKLLAMRTPMWRSKFIVALMALASLGLVVRAMEVQVLGRDGLLFGKNGLLSGKEEGSRGDDGQVLTRLGVALKEPGESKRQHILPANRGRIFDRNGRLLASSMEVRDIGVSPKVVESEQGKVGALANLLEMQESELRRLMDSGGQESIWLRRNAGKTLAKKVGELKVAGVYVEREGEGRSAMRHIRLEPQEVRQEGQKVAELARLLNMPEKELRAKMSEERDVIDKESGAKRMEKRPYVGLRRQVDVLTARKIAELKVPGVQQDVSYKRVYPEGEALTHVVGVTSIDDKGQEGVELAFDKQLAGQPGSQVVRVNRFGEAVEAVGARIPPVEGRDVHLSIDSRVQSVVDQTRRDAVQRNKAQAGSVVVLDARSGEVLAMVNYPSYAPGENRRLKTLPRNIAITDAFEPGSTMKPITVAMALEAGKVTPQTLFNTAPGRYQLGRFTVSDTHNYGTLTVEGVIQKSSNIGSLKIAQRLTAQQMWETYDALGYGRRPDLNFPGAATGVVRPWKNWQPSEQATMSYGYGLSASPFQVAHSYTVFTNEGRVIDATLLKVPEGQEPRGVQVFSPENVQAVRRMLRMAVEPGGTGTLAQTEDYSVGGKTGTARKQIGKKGYTNRYRSWFTGLAPFEQPRVVVAVMIDEPSAGSYTGGTVAAPVFSQVAQYTLRTLGVQPDRAAKPDIVVAQEEQGDGSL